jgi:hypothetical protein
MVHWHDELVIMPMRMGKGLRERCKNRAKNTDIAAFAPVCARCCE